MADLKEGGVMSVSKTTNGRWRARIKSGRVDVASRTFDRKKDAQDWEAAQRRSLDLSEFIDPRAGKESVASAWERWQGTRQNSKSEATHDTDRAAYKTLPATLRNRPVSAVTASHFESLYDDLLGTLARSSVMRYRVSFGSFFSWAVRERLCRVNPALAVRVPTGHATGEKESIYPFTIDELRAVHADAAEQVGATLAAPILFMGLTGLRPGEVVALRVRDVQRLPVPALRVTRTKSENKSLRNITKGGGGARTVPIADDAWALIEPLTRDREPNELLFPTRSGGFLSLSSWKRDVKWKAIKQGRRVYDLRHTAATWWLSEGVPLHKVSAWLGHTSTKITAERYIHYLGPANDVHDVAKLNRALAGDIGGTRADSQESGAGHSAL